MLIIFWLKWNIKVAKRTINVSMLFSERKKNCCCCDVCLQWRHMHFRLACALFQLNFFGKWIYYCIMRRIFWQKACHNSKLANCFKSQIWNDWLRGKDPKNKLRLALQASKSLEWTRFLHQAMRQLTMSIIKKWTEQNCSLNYHIICKKNLNLRKYTRIFSPKTYVNLDNKTFK